MEGHIDGASGTSAQNAMSAAPAVSPLQLAQLARLLPQELGDLEAAAPFAPFFDPLRQLAAAGVPIRDLADAIYSNPFVRDALRSGDTARAAGAVASWIGEHIHELRASGIAEDHVQQLSRAGFGLEEICLSLQIVPGLRNELLHGHFRNPQAWAQAMHEALRGQGRLTHEHPELLAPRAAESRNGALPWSEQYLHLARNLQSRFASLEENDEVRLSTDHPDLEDEALLPVVVPVPRREQTGVHVAAWLAAALVVSAALVLLLQHC